MALKDFLQAAEASQFVALFEFTIGQEVIRFTTYNKDFTFQSEVYIAGPLDAKGFTADTKTQPISLKITMNLTDPATRYIANTPAEIITVKITFVLLADPLEFSIFYQGRVMSVGLNEKNVSLNCESKSDIFRQKTPNVLHTSLCNNILFDTL